MCWSLSYFTSAFDARRHDFVLSVKLVWILYHALNYTFNGVIYICGGDGMSGVCCQL